MEPPAHTTPGYRLWGGCFTAVPGSPQGARTAAPDWSLLKELVSEAEKSQGSSFPADTSPWVGAGGSQPPCRAGPSPEAEHPVPGFLLQVGSLSRKFKHPKVPVILWFCGLAEFGIILGVAPHTTQGQSGTIWALRAPCVVAEWAVTRCPHGACPRAERGRPLHCICGFCIPELEKPVLAQHPWDTA